MGGTLFVVATPIGNLGDLSERASQTLRQVGLVAAEDTRRTKQLLSHLGASPRMLSFHANSPSSRVDRVLRALDEGTDVALVTDAGTPTVSDPGAELVAAARKREVVVVPIPGPSAVTTALSMSGFPADRYTFLGFLPRKGKERRKLLSYVAASQWTVAFFESPNRLADTLLDLADCCGANRQIAVAREITKIFEEFRTGTPGELAVYYGGEVPKGEVTVLVAGTTGREAVMAPEAVLAQARELIADGMSRRDAASHIANSMGLPRNDVYSLVSRI